mgnify:CR=1 FL=1
MGLLRSLVPFFGFAAVYLVIAMMVENSYYQLIITLVLVWASFGLSWNMLSGYTGLISFGHAAFFGLGAFATVLAQRYFGISPWVMLPVSALIGAVAGLLHRTGEFRSVTDPSEVRCMEDMLLGVLRERPARLLVILAFQVAANLCLILEAWVALDAMGFDVPWHYPLVIEGAIKFVTVSVTGASSDADARTHGLAIAATCGKDRAGASCRATHWKERG